MLARTPCKCTVSGGIYHVCNRIYKCDTMHTKEIRYGNKIWEI